MSPHVIFEGLHVMFGACVLQTEIGDVGAGGLRVLMPWQVSQWAGMCRDGKHGQPGAWPASATGTVGRSVP